MTNSTITKKFTVNRYPVKRQYISYGFIVLYGLLVCLFILDQLSLQKPLFIQLPPLFIIVMMFMLILLPKLRTMQYINNFKRYIIGRKTVLGYVIFRNDSFSFGYEDTIDYTFQYLAISKYKLTNQHLIIHVLAGTYTIDISLFSPKEINKIANLLAATRGEIIAGQEIPV